MTEEIIYLILTDLPSIEIKTESEYETRRMPTGHSIKIPKAFKRKCKSDLKLKLKYQINDFSSEELNFIEQVFIASLRRFIDNSILDEINRKFLEGVVVGLLYSNLGLKFKLISTEIFTENLVCEKWEQMNK